jgi:hypothetical protein
LYSQTEPEYQGAQLPLTQEQLFQAVRSSQEALRTVAHLGSFPSDVLIDASRIARLSLPAQSTLTAITELGRNYSRLGTTVLDATRLILPSPEALRAFASVGQRVVEDAQRVVGLLARIDEDYSAALPLNLHEIDEARGYEGIEEAAQLAEVDGIPIAWIPRGEIVQALIAEPDSTARFASLGHYRGEIIVDCEHALASIDNEWGNLCRDAIIALKSAAPAAAQALGANIMDSVVRRALRGTSAAKTTAAMPIEDVIIREIGRALTLKPLIKSLAQWHPDSGHPLPANFSRHVTTHAAGEAGAYSPTFALVAVMLATSLTCQYRTGRPS